MTDPKPVFRVGWTFIPIVYRSIAVVAGSGLVLSMVGCAGAAPAVDYIPTAKPRSSTSAQPSASPAPAVGFTESDPGDPSTVTGSTDPTAVAISDGTATNTTAIALLATLAVKGKAPKTGYDRTANFGQAWLDVDRNGCDTRNDILARDLITTVKAGSCKVLSGSFIEPYTGRSMNFFRGNTTSTLVQIDHVVSLSNAWQTGAQQLSQSQRFTFANDPLNLLAVDGRSNSQKGDGDTATWLPSNKAFRCDYVSRQVSVKATYGLWVTQAEKEAMVRILRDCPNARALTSSFAPAPVGVVPVPAPAVPAPGSTFYANCTAVHAAGAAPIRAGDPGYAPKFDRDGDGVGCE
ncbi:DUF1524 domain-containing protein [Frigoribacterium sp. CG_9.8]|uniref:GmrSD restriction endonuclease domain-containing protein n=1 Tax=Frigoribacterium sp. CG_9.8 TaxID=2787733 RepID=UPI0018C94248|nr:DUF1524 domain-containing protein [Frigoribacterium sp. CG_9.8]MBG6109005.1 hypothetical protein [Frigoribacterium sp. CG_9.8]